MTCKGMEERKEMFRIPELVCASPGFDEDLISSGFRDRYAVHLSWRNGGGDLSKDHGAACAFRVKCFCFSIDCSYMDDSLRLASLM